MQKYIYDLRAIYSEDLSSFINIADILHNNTILSIQDVSQKILFKNVLTQLMAYQVFSPFLGTKYSCFLCF